MTKSKRRVWTLLLTITFPLWAIPAVAIFWVVAFIALLYAACADCVEIVEDFILNRSKRRNDIDEQG